MEKIKADIQKTLEENQTEPETDPEDQDEIEGENAEEGDQPNKVSQACIDLCALLKKKTEKW